MNTALINVALRPATHRLLALAVAMALASAGCKKTGGEVEQSEGNASAAQAAPAAAPVTNRIDIPEQVRQNLGITFAKVERRQVAATLRVPGRFELLPSGKREYRAAVPGQVTLLVKQYDRVEVGTPLFRVQSPDWLKLRQQLQEDRSAVLRAEAGVKSAEASKAEAEQAAALIQDRVTKLAEAGTRRAELEAQLAERRASLPRLEAETAAKRADLEAASERFPLTLATAAALTGLPADQLSAEVSPPSGAGAAVPRWQSFNEIEVRATQGGIVDAFGVTNGSWAEQGSLLLSTVDPQQIRFRASALQSDLGRLREGAVAAIVPPRGATAGADEGIPAKLSLALEASADTRTVELVLTPEKPVAWARPGVSAFAEVVTQGTGETEAAIPVAAVVQDELAKIYFRRDPKDPDKAIRVEGDLGVSDGRWIVVRSGLQAGDEVVLDGVFELKLAGGGKAGGGGGGHFHADGTWHAAGTPESGGKK